MTLKRIEALGSPVINLALQLLSTFPIITLESPRSFPSFLIVETCDHGTMANVGLD